MNRATHCLLLLLAPFPAAAQGFTVAPFAAMDRGLDGAPGLAGLAATVWSGPVGVRLGGALDVASTPVGALFGSESPGSIQAWTADLDMVLSGGRAGIRLGRVEPGVFVGFGVHGRRGADGVAATIPAWSYGATASLPLARWLDLAGEARYRMPHESDPDQLPDGVGGGLELRAGLAVSFGRPPARTVGPTVARPAGRTAPRTLHVGGRADGGPAPDAPAPAAGATDARAAGALRTADAYVGYPYRWGGASPSEGFDCSGYVQYVYARNGVRLPRVSRDQARAGSPVPARVSAFRPGDLLFFAGEDGVVSHVAIYAGDGTIVHASDSRGVVSYDRLDSRRGRWYATHLVAARRVLY